LQFLIKKNIKIFSALFSSIFGYQILVPESDPDSLETLDPDPQHCLLLYWSCLFQWGYEVRVNRVIFFSKATCPPLVIRPSSLQPKAYTFKKNDKKLKNLTQAIFSGTE
jgi:hypothetical protein